MMAKKELKPEHIVYDNLEDIMSDRFARYSKYIIQERALPDARDGLKPVQRRILYAMYEDGNTYNKPYHKSAKTVGNVIGNYHPHGDSSVYDAMVRLSQDWKITNPLIDMQGNNGSIDDDPAAAMRYTEARLSHMSEYLLDDIYKNTVEWAPNFSDEKMEPTVLPARFPNLLINGISGIAAGYATNIPPHNLNEVVEACIYRIKHPDCTLDELMTIVKGPDFPTGGIAMGLAGIRQAFETGRGKVIVRSKVRIEQNKKEQQIIVSEIPYEVVKSQMVKKIDEIRLNKKIDGITDVRDESDRTGLRVVVILKKDANAQAILKYLYKNTDLQVAYNYNVIAIVDKAPVQMSLSQCLDAFIHHREDVILRRSRYELAKKQERSHILEGLIKAVSVMDEVIRIIRQSKNKADAKVNLIDRFEFSEEQAEAIVTMRLYRLTNTDVKELKSEFRSLSKDIKRLKQIIAKKDVLHQLIITELQQINEEIITPRKTAIEEEVEDLSVDQKDMIADEQVVIPITREGYIKRVSVRSYESSSNPITGHKDSDDMLFHGTASTLDTLLFFTSSGKYGYLPVYKLEEAKWKDLGSHIGNYLKMDANERIVQAYVLDTFDPRTEVILASRYGMIKRTRLSELEVSRMNKTMVCMKIGSMDELISVNVSYHEDDEVVVCSRNGYAAIYPVNQISEMACKTKGVKALNLSKQDTVADVKVITKEVDQLLVVTEKMMMKRIKVSEVFHGNRPVKGSLISKLIKSNPNYVYKVYPTTAESVFTISGTERIQLMAKEVPIKNAGATYSSPYGKMEKFTIHEPLCKIEIGTWKAEQPEAFVQGTLFI